MFSRKTSVMETAIIISDHAGQASVQNPGAGQASVQNLDVAPDFSIISASVEHEPKKKKLLHVIIFQID